MNSLQVRMDAALWRRLHSVHLHPSKRMESLTYLWARCEQVGAVHIALIPPDAPIFSFGPDCYERQSSSNVRLKPEVLNGMLAEFAASDWNCLVNVHDHWFNDDARFSAEDDRDDLRFDRYLRERFEPMLRAHPEIGPSRPIFNLSIVLGRRRCAARLTDSTVRGNFIPAQQVALLGDRWGCAPLAEASSGRSRAGPAVARHEGYLSAEDQRRISGLHLAQLGCGGIGSIVAESVARLPIARLTLVDGDQLEGTNLNRWQGARPGDVGRPKADLLARNVAAMCPRCEVLAVPLPLEDPKSVAAIAAADIVVGCLDNDVARYLTNQICLQYMQPYFDAGVRIERRPRVDFLSRYFAVIPGVTGCLECKAFSLIDRNAVVAGISHPAVTASLRQAGYLAEGPELPAPSAYSLNQRAAGALVQELLNYVVGWRSTATVILERWSDQTLQRSDRDNYPETPLSDCPVCSLCTGRGSLVPLPRPSITDLTGVGSEISTSSGIASAGARDE